VLKNKRVRGVMSVDYNVLKDLVKVPSVSGREELVREVIVRHLKPHVDEIRTDALGNVIAIIKGSSERKVAIECHYDQVGFIVKSIEKSGLLRIEPIGGVDVRTIIGSRLIIWGREKKIPGVVAGVKPVHLEEKKEQIPKIGELYVDAGFDSSEDASKYVRVGDVATYDLQYMELFNDKIAATGLDNKISAFIMIELARRVQDIGDWNLYLVFTSQEEVGLRGARTAFYGIYPEMAISLDVTHAQYPPISQSKVPIELGKGPAVMIAPAVHPKVLKLLEDAAQIGSVGVQYETAGRFTGTNLDAIQVTRSGIPGGLVSIPLKYMHTPLEVASKKDVESTITLLESFLRLIKEI